MYSDDYGNDDDNDVQQQHVKRRKSRTKDFSEEEKKTLAALIKKEKQLWDCSQTRSTFATLDNLWTKIGIQMGKPKDKCKLAWVALRESYRYHEKRSKTNDPLGRNKLNWEFAKDLAFLANGKRVNQNVYPYMEISNDDAMDTSLDQDDHSTQNYIVKDEFRALSEVDNYHRESHDNSSELNISDESHNSLNGEQTNEQETTDFDGYNSKEHSNKKSDSLTYNSTEMANLIRQLGNLINAQTEFMQHYRKRSSETLAFQTQLVSCDSLLQQLPRKIAETTLVEIQNYILKKINDQQKSKTNE